MKSGEGQVYLTFLENLCKTSAEKEKAQSDGGANTIKMLRIHGALTYIVKQVWIRQDSS